MEKAPFEVPFLWPCAGLATGPNPILWSGLWRQAASSVAALLPGC